MNTVTDVRSEVIIYGRDILMSDGMQSEKQFIQHGDVSVFAHSVNVSIMAVYITRLFNIRLDKRALVRGALLHDYFLYDWHIKAGGHKLHGFRHAASALKNAERDFELNDIERDIIKKHMFPLNIRLPKYRESVIIGVSDKICAVCEMMSVSIGGRNCEEVLR